MKKTPDFWVGDRVVRPSLGEIRLGLERIHLEPRSIEVLVALSQRAPEVATKQELIEAVWGESFVTDEVLTHAIWDLRRAFGDNASNPEFIQTIPKRGYRLIAPVKQIEGNRGETGARVSMSRAFLIGMLVIVAALAAVSVWLSRSDPPGPPRDFRPVSAVLRLVPVDAPEGSSGWSEGLESQLLAKLAGIPLVELGSEESCSVPNGSKPTYCVRPILTDVTDGYQISVQLIEAASQNLIYSTPDIALSSRAGLGAAATEIADLVAVCLEVFRNWDPEDPDVRPWISLQKHDIRAVRDFLAGQDYVDRNEIGARDPFATAIEFDSDFIAPWVWRTGTLMEEADAQGIADHRARLAGLYDGATAFEKAMILWATAHIDGKPSEGLRQIRVALKGEPDNRPIRMILAFTYLQLGDAEMAWQELDLLMATGWCNPALYAMSAGTAFSLEKIEEARKALERSLQCEVVDPVTLALLRVVAIYDDESALATDFANRLALRLKEMQEESPEIDVSNAANLLAARAETEGRQEISARLREFAD